MSKKASKTITFDYRDPKQLQHYIDVYGRIEPRSKTGLSAKQQHALRIAVERARFLALLPFTVKD